MWVKAHQADLQTKGSHDLSYLRYWVDEQHAKTFCAGMGSSDHTQACRGLLHPGRDHQVCQLNRRGDRCVVESTLMYLIAA
jgi:hypothetical protein